MAKQSHNLSIHEATFEIRRLETLIDIAEQRALLEA
jgi:hypothetical protein